MALVGREDRLEARRLNAVLERGESLLVETQVFVELEEDGRRFRMGGTVSGAHDVSLAADPSSELLRIAQDAREVHLGCSWRRNTQTHGRRGVN